MTSIDPEDLDEQDEDACTLCGTPVTTRAESAYAFGTGSQLCFECAMARGGRYDAELDTWDPAPDVAGLPDEAYGTAPHERRRS